MGNYLSNYTGNYKLKTSFLSSSLFLTVFTMLGIGLVQVYSSSFIFATESYADGLYFFKRQALFTLIGFFVLIVMTQISMNFIKKWAWAIWFLSIFLLVLTFIPGLGVRVGGALRWIQLPFGFRFEPAELLKLAFCLFLSSLVCKGQTPLRNIKWGYIFLLTIAPFLLLLKQPDFGSFAILIFVGFSLLFVFGLSFKFLIPVALSAVPIFYFLIWNVGYRKARVQAFIDPWSDPAQKGFQVIQSMMSIRSGGLTGVGLGQSQGKLFFLPEAHTDFTMAILGEELGFMGIIIILMLFGFLAFKGFQIALAKNDLFQKTLALGLTSTFAISVFVNIAVVLGLLPTKGLTLPFLSYGGSSLVMICFLFGLLLNIEMSDERSS